MESGLYSTMAMFVHHLVASKSKDKFEKKKKKAIKKHESNKRPKLDENPRDKCFNCGRKEYWRKNVQMH